MTFFPVRNISISIIKNKGEIDRDREIEEYRKKEREQR
jgi:hypothetical protein